MVLMDAYHVVLVVLDEVVVRPDTVGVEGVHVDMCVAAARGLSALRCHLSVRLFSAFSSFYGCADDAYAAWRIDVSSSFARASSILIIYASPVVLPISSFAFGSCV